MQKYGLRWTPAFLLGVGHLVTGSRRALLDQHPVKPLGRDCYQLAGLATFHMYSQFTGEEIKYILQDSTRKGTLKLVPGVPSFAHESFAFADFALHPFIEIIIVWGMTICWVLRTLLVSHQTWGWLVTLLTEIHGFKYINTYL